MCFIRVFFVIMKKCTISVVDFGANFIKCFSFDNFTSILASYNKILQFMFFLRIISSNRCYSFFKNIMILLEQRIKDFTPQTSSLFINRGRI